MRWLNTLLPWVLLLHAVLFLVFWLTNAVFYVDTNNYLAGKLGSSMDYIRLVLALSAGLAIWSALRILFPTLLILRPAGLNLAAIGLFDFLSLAYLVLFYASFALLFRESPVQKTRIFQMLEYYRILIDPILLLGLAFLLGNWLRSAGFSWNRAAPLLVVLILAWAAALLFPPSSVYRGKMPAKPRLIAHRGASMLAPENTLAAARSAAALSAYGIETDVRVSLDGQLFLMHDDTLARTTDAASIFPERQSQRAETFTRAELDRLSAGVWFNQSDPFGTIRQKRVTPVQSAAYLQEPVPSFADWLQIAKQGGQVVIFDLQSAPEGHPFQTALFEMALQQLQSAGMDAQTWFLTNYQQAAILKARAPQMKLTAAVDSDHPASPEDLLSAGYQIVNVEYTLPAAQIRRYRQAGLWVNLWTVDEPWQFSRLWLSGADSVTTNNLPGLSSLAQPWFALARPSFCPPGV